MSSSCRQKQGFHRRLQAAGSTQKADLLTCPTGHPGPGSPSQSQPPKGTKPYSERTTQGREDTPNSQKWKKTQTLTCEKKKEVKKQASNSTIVDSEVLRSRKNEAKFTSPHSRTTENTHPGKNGSSASFSGLQEEASSSSKQPKQSSIQEGLSSEAFDRRPLAQQNIWAGGKLHESKLIKKLKSVQSWPSRDRLSVCGDVFDDVCEGLPLFGRILREIKTEYDLYVNHLMASQSPQHNMPMNALVEDIGRSKVREKELEEAEKEVCRLEQQATRSLEENKRLKVQHELQNIPATTGPEDRTSADASVWENAALRSDVSSSKRLQVLHVAKEVLQLEEEVQEKLVSRVTTSAAERLLQELKAEIMTLIASNHRLRTMNQDLEIRLHAVLQKEKGSQATGRMLWDQIYEDLHLRETPNCSSDD
ncbi:uncharacterized protein C6orf118 homolog [Oryzias latipes]|uniref:uncharacterized protein C6orf118 homolog n=1 Tax=Oryzias latipes TaxID=8090 RepID=UPI0002A4B27A|nr:uncharacterized protein C6orf118 homolog [Oryzias latipes]XP_020565374.1 uncharacterized protein C6orf118 homolog [Oryzias latipes]XP_023818962.1 uncharacterized protein C6orf118 homolog [Oryzias latipes]